MNDIPQQRLVTHGNFKTSAGITHRLMQIFEEQDNWEILLPTQQEAMHMIAIKLARIMAGDANFPDHWDDIAGYAQLGKLIA